MRRGITLISTVCITTGTAAVLVRITPDGLKGLIPAVLITVGGLVLFILYANGKDHDE